MEYQKEHATSRPFYVIDPDTGKLVKLNLPADAIAPEAKPGFKAGNVLVDELNEQLRREGLLAKLKGLYKK